MSELVAALVEQGIEPRQYYPELGPGQQELSIKHGSSALGVITQHR
jgi:glutamine synthetase